MKNFVDVAYEQLIISGGDNRLLLGENGLNPYGCGPHSNGQLAFGSCTCSSPSTRSTKAAKAAIDRLRRSFFIQDEADRIRREHRQRLQKLLGLPNEVDIAFTPSGTDVELLALALAAGGHQRRVVNIVVGPTEVGSGTTLAAAGMHYDNLLPSGTHVISGTPVCPTLADRVTLKTIDIRDDRGEIINEVYLDAFVTEVVAEAVANDAHVLLHLVAHSKTGMHAPSLECVDRISRSLPDAVTIVIDAAQGRVSRRGLREVLGKGHLVMFTGSKFYGGPPFSGALLVPPRWQPRHLGICALPNAFGDYFTAAELPESWSGLRRQMTSRQNYGSLLRWEAALAEMDAYYRVPSRCRLAVLRAFEESVPEIFDDAAGIQLLTVFPPIHDDSQTRLLESKTTVFGFLAQVNGHALGRDELRAIHAELNTAFTAVSSQSPMSRRFHIGQPVPLNDRLAALRIAIGGEMIVRVATDLRLGTSLGERIDWLRNQLISLRRKTEALIAMRAMSQVSPERVRNVTLIVN